MAGPITHTGAERKNGGKALFLAALAFILAVIAMLILAAAGFGSRFGFWHFRTGFTLLSFGGWCGLAAMLTALGSAAYSSRNKRHLPLVVALVAVILGALAFSVPLRWKLTVQRLPRIHDITTDTLNPPRFMALLPLRKDAANPAEYGGPDIAVPAAAGISGPENGDSGNPCRQGL